MLTRYFDTHELLPDGHTDTDVLDPALLILIDQVRELLGVPCTINADGRQYCGWRPEDCPVGAKHSQHKLGKAADLHPQGMSAEVARHLIRKAVDAGMLPLLGSMETDVSWVHVACDARVNGKVRLFHA